MSTPNKLTATILPTGTMHADLNWLLTSPLSMASRSEPGKVRDWVEVPAHSVLIEHPSGKKLLWDTGVPRDWEDRWAPYGLGEYFPADATTEDMWLDSRLKQLGLEAGNIDYVVVSHLHLDHAGNLNWWRDTNTQVIVGEEEKKGALSFDGLNFGGHLKTDYDEVELTTVKDDTELLPGVTLLQTPGHTWGTLSLQVDLEDSGTMIFTSDSVYAKENYGPPAAQAGMVYDTVAWYGSVEKLRGIQEKTDATMVFGHSAEQITQLRTGPGNSYT